VGETQGLLCFFFGVALVAYAILVVLVTERDIVRAPIHHPWGRRGERVIDWLEEEASGWFLNCHESSIAEIGGNCKLYFTFLFAFVGDEKGLEEAAIIAERCDPSLALGACASELLILRPLMVNDVTVCFGSLFLDGHESILAEIRENCKVYFDFFQAVWRIASTLFRSIQSSPPSSSMT